MFVLLPLLAHVCGFSAGIKYLKCDWGIHNSSEQKCTVVQKKRKENPTRRKSKHRYTKYTNNDALAPAEKKCVIRLRENTGAERKQAFRYDPIRRQLREAGKAPNTPSTVRGKKWVWGYQPCWAEPSVCWSLELQQHRHSSAIMEDTLRRC